MPGKTLSITLPTVGQTTWGGTLNTVLQAFIDDLEPKVRASEINIDSELEINSNDIIEVNSIQVDNRTTTLAGAGNTRKLYMANNDWYANDGDGNVIKLTSQGALALSASGIRGIGGDYSADLTANVNYSSTSDTYTFLADDTVPATLITGDLELREESSGIVKGVTLKSPASLASEYTVTFPTGTPENTSLVTMDISGNLALTREPTLDSVTTGSLAVQGGNATMDGALTVDGVTNVGALGVTGATTLNSTLAVTGQATLTGGVAALSVAGASTLTGDVTCEGNVTIEGTLTDKTEYRDMYPASMAVADSGSPTFIGPYWQIDSIERVMLPVPFRRSRRVKSVVVDYYKTNSGTSTLQLKYSNGIIETVLASTTTNSTIGFHQVTLSSIDQIIQLNWYLYFTAQGSSTGERLYGIQVLHDDN